MSVIEASSAGVRDMADGSLRITLEFEPRHAKQAYSLFGSRGTPVAVAALKTAAQAEPDKPKGGALSKWLAIRCGEPAFHEFIQDQAAHFLPLTTIAATLSRAVCEITSRAELDNDPEAAQRFHDRIRGPWLASQEKT